MDFLGYVLGTLIILWVAWRLFVSHVTQRTELDEAGNNNQSTLVGYGFKLLGLILATPLFLAGVIFWGQATLWLWGIAGVLAWPYINDSDTN